MWVYVCGHTTGVVGHRRPAVLALRVPSAQEAIVGGPNTLAMAHNCANSDFAANSGRPVNNSAMMHPTAHKSMGLL